MTTAPKKILLPLYYLPPVEYFALIAGHDELVLEFSENYQRQTYRNRCEICTTNGKLPLTIPVKKGRKKTPICEMEISYDHNWQRNHWESIVSAYSSSPYFEFYSDRFESLFRTEFRLLTEFNLNLLKTVFSLLKWDKGISFTTEYFADYGGSLADHRESVSAKKENLSRFEPYTQVFSPRLGFIPNLSILDLLFNKGPYSSQYLQKGVFFQASL